MNNRHDGERSFYRKDYNPNKPLYYILAGLVLVSGLVWFVFFNKDSASGNNPVDQQTIARNGIQENSGDGSGVGESHDGDNRGSVQNDPSSYDEQDSGSDGSGSITDQLKSEFDMTEPDSVEISTDSSGSEESGKNSSEIFSKSDNEAVKKFYKAHEYFFAKKYKDAMYIYSDLAARDTRVEIYVGMCHYHLGMLKTAIVHLEIGLQADPGNVLALKYLAFAAYKEDNLEQSLKYAEKGLAVRQDNELSNLKNKLKREIKTMEHYGQTERVNFNISFSKMEEGNVRSMVIVHLEDAYREIGKQLNFYPSKPITVILYNEKGFFDVTRSPGWAGALFDGKIRLPIDGLEENDAELKRILYHEYSHALVSALLGEFRCPVWVNEGLAEYFSNDHGKKIGQLIPLSSLEQGFPSGDTRAVLAAYVESYSAVSYLIDRYKLYNIRTFLDSLAQGNDLKKAFSSAFYISYDRFLETWGKDQ